MMFVIKKQVYYDSFSQCYKNILVINKKPTGLLEKYVKQIRYVPPSPFQAEANRNNCYCQNSCIYAITNPNGCGFFCAEHVAEFFTFIIELGYTIETSLTKLTRQSNETDIICIISQ